MLLQKHSKFPKEVVEQDTDFNVFPSKSKLQFLLLLGIKKQFKLLVTQMCIYNYCLHSRLFYFLPFI